MLKVTGTCQACEAKQVPVTFVRLQRFRYYTKHHNLRGERGIAEKLAYGQAVDLTIHRERLRGTRTGEGAPAGEDSVRE
mgnify:CR=1 FL=1